MTMRSVASRLASLALLVTAVAVPTLTVAQVTKDPPPVVDDATGKIRGLILGDFQRRLDRAGAGLKVQACQRVLHYVPQAGNGKDTSWGVVCNVKGQGPSQMLVMACDDDLIGMFTMRYPAELKRPALVAFITENCPPGG